MQHKRRQVIATVRTADRCHILKGSTEVNAQLMVRTGPDRAAIDLQPRDLECPCLLQRQLGGRYRTCL